MLLKYQYKMAKFLRKEVSEYNMIDIIRTQSTMQNDLRNINTERPVASLSLRISDTVAVALTTAGTTIPWSAELRNLLFTWSGTDITIPNNGYYHICYYMRTNINLTSLDGKFGVTRSGISYLPGQYRLTQTTSATAYTFSFMHYFLENDILSINLQPSANCNLLYRPETTGSGGQSGIVHITQLTGTI